MLFVRQTTIQTIRLQKKWHIEIIDWSYWIRGVSFKCCTTFMYKNSCGFVCEEFPKEIQTLQTRNDLWLST